MDPGFDKNKALAEGYRLWLETDREAWNTNLVGELLADDVTITDEELKESISGKSDVLDKLARLKTTTIVDPYSVRVGTTHDRTVSFGCDREKMEDPARQRQGWHTCFDKFEWDGADKINAIYVCPADDHSPHSHV